MWPLPVFKHVIFAVRANTYQCLQQRRPSKISHTSVDVLMLNGVKRREKERETKSEKEEIFKGGDHVKPMHMYAAI